jgi:CheY-like chemotaxis protein
MSFRVLVVEDDPGVRETFSDLLGAAGHHVTAASSHAEAVRLLAQGRWDALLTDLVLPGGSGMELAARARAMGIGAVVCSGHPGRIEPMHGRGIVHLVKPFSAATLEAALVEVVAAAQPGVGR